MYTQNFPASAIGMWAVCWSLALGSVEGATPKFEARVVDDKISIGYGVALADMDGDRKVDIVLADKGQFVWYQNPTWTKHVMAERLTPEDHVCLAAADIDGDGRAEVAVGAGWNPGDTEKSGAVFYLVPPADRTRRWEPVRLHHEPTVHRMRWVQDEKGQFALAVWPLHGRGNKGGAGAGVRGLIYRVPSDARGEWATELIDDTLHMTHNFDVVPKPSGKGQDLWVCGKEGIFRMSREAEGWRRTPLGGPEGRGVPYAGAGEVRSGRLGQGRVFAATVEPMHGHQVVIYQASTETPAGSKVGTVAESRPTGLWERRVIDETLVDGHAVVCGDFLGLGRDQVVVGWRAMNRVGAKVGIKMYIPRDETGAAWDSTLIDDNQMACEDLAIGDLDGDGRLDLVAAGRASRNVKVYWNRNP